MMRILENSVCTYHESSFNSFRDHISAVNINGYIMKIFSCNKMNSMEPAAAEKCIRMRHRKSSTKHGASNDLSDFQEDVASGLCYISSNFECNGVPHLQRYVKYAQKNADIPKF